MPSYHEHESLGFWLGGTAGLVATALSSPSPLTLVDAAASFLGGGLAGRFGAAVPDGLEPATHPGHRGVAHSGAAAALCGYGAAKAVQAAEQLQATASLPDMSPLERLMLRFAGAAVVGAPVGVVSHIAADASTPNGVPLLSRGFSER